jgi:hypothetical protein
MTQKPTQYEMAVLKSHGLPRSKSTIPKRNKAQTSLIKMKLLEFSDGLYHLTKKGKEFLDDPE